MRVVFAPKVNEREADFFVLKTGLHKRSSRTSEKTRIVLDFLKSFALQDKLRRCWSGQVRPDFPKRCSGVRS